MTRQLPDPLVRALENELEKSPASARQEQRAVEELFELFTRKRSSLKGLNYLDLARLRSAYLRYHLPLNFARAAHCLEHIKRAWPAIDGLERIVDLGAGPGSASLAAHFTLSDSPREYVLYDKSRNALRLARTLFAACTSESESESESESASASATASDPKTRIRRPNPGVTSTVRTRVRSLPLLPEIDAPSLVLFTMVLNELRVAERGGPSAAEFAARLGERIPTDSVVVIVEPALRGPGRNLLAVHDALLSVGGWAIIAPCTHHTSCPLRDEHGRPWCHFHFSWKPPEFVTQAAEPLGLEPANGAYSFLAVRRVAVDAPRPQSSPEIGRIVSDPMRVQHDRRGVYVCRDGKRSLAVDPPHEIKRGDVVAVAEDRVTRVETWDHDGAARTLTSSRKVSGEESPGERKRGKKKRGSRTSALAKYRRRDASPGGHGPAKGGSGRGRRTDRKRPGGNR